jgi:hypothetical protein
VNISQPDLRSEKSDDDYDDDDDHDDDDDDDNNNNNNIDCRVKGKFSLSRVLRRMVELSYNSTHSYS